MKKLTRIVIGLVFGWSVSALSADAPPVENALLTKDTGTAVVEPAKSAAPAPAATAAKSEKVEHNFEDLLVQGKYHFSDEAVTTVEEDKVLDSLLGIRTDFKDKIEQSAGRY
jgi:hypothetical protein